jgi:hypothetical protein
VSYFIAGGSKYDQVAPTKIGQQGLHDQQHTKSEIKFLKFPFTGALQCAGRWSLT